MSVCPKKLKFLCILLAFGSFLFARRLVEPKHTVQHCTRTSLWENLKFGSFSLFWGQKKYKQILCGANREAILRKLGRRMHLFMGKLKMRLVLFAMLATCLCCEAFLPSFHPGSCSNLHALKQTVPSTSRMPTINPSRRRQSCSMAKMSIAKPVGGVEVTLPSTDKILSILRAIGLDAAEAAELINCGKVFEASPGDDIMNEGQSVAVKRSLFLLVDGGCTIESLHIAVAGSCHLPCL